MGWRQFFSTLACGNTEFLTRVSDGWMCEGGIDRLARCWWWSVVRGSVCTVHAVLVCARVEFVGMGGLHWIGAVGESAYVRSFFFFFLFF